MLVGLLADTHVPYRALEILPAAVMALQGVDVILHAGDVDDPACLAPLRALAPVHAVRGNFHLLDLSSGGASLPEHIALTLAGWRVVVTHGHRMGAASLVWKVRYVLRQLRGCTGGFPAYDAAIARTLLRRFPNADVIVFGHTHRYYEARWGQTLIINPGAALASAYFNLPAQPSVARLKLFAGDPPQVTRVLL